MKTNSTTTKENKNKILSFAGSFNHVNQEDYDDFIEESRKTSNELFDVTLTYEANFTAHRLYSLNFFRGNTKVLENVNTYLTEYPSLNFSIISYYEILNGILYKDAKKQLRRFNEFVELNKVIPLTINVTKKLQKFILIFAGKVMLLDTLIHSLPE